MTLDEGEIPEAVLVNRISADTEPWPVVCHLAREGVSAARITKITINHLWNPWSLQDQVRNLVYLAKPSWRSHRPSSPWVENQDVVACGWAGSGFSFGPARTALDRARSGC